VSVSDRNAITVRSIDFCQDALGLKDMLGEDAPLIAQLEPAVDEGQAFILVSEAGGRVAGWVVVRTAYREDTGWSAEGDTASYVIAPKAYLEYLEVSEAFRRQGVGTKLVEAAEVEASARDRDALWLHVREENTGAIRLYEQLAWRHRDTIHPSWMQGEPTRVYRKSLSRQSE
jgi:ribosomal protein S18 acetylase RimI-like enzyme